MKFTWQKVIVFLCIIGAGIIGLMIADRYDFINGRNDTAMSIGAGDGTVTTNNSSVPAVTKPKQSSASTIDGVKTKTSITTKKTAR